MEDKHASLLLVTVEVAEEDVEELNRWYEEEHGPEKMSLPGYLGVRRFQQSDGSPRFLAIYELSDPEAALGPEAMTPESSRRMQDFMSKWKQWDRSVWVEI
jgi:hypothetical protein